MKKIIVNLDEESSQELKKIKKITGCTTEEIFRYSFSLLRIYVKETEKGNCLFSVDPKNEDIITEIVLPLEI